MANKYGSITVDGNLSDWTLAEELDNSATDLGRVTRFMAPTFPTAPTCPTTCSASARARRGTVIGAGTTIYLDTDNNKATGFQIFGGIGAEYEVVFDSTGHALSLGLGRHEVNVQVGPTPLDFAFNGPADTKRRTRHCRHAALAGAPTSIQADISLERRRGRERRDLSAQRFLVRRRSSPRRSRSAASS